MIGSAKLTGGLVNHVEAAVMLRGTEADDFLAARASDIWAERDRKLEAARTARAERRAAASTAACQPEVAA